MASKHLQKSIYLVGPHSTGKSTLAKALVEYYGIHTPVLQEVARKVLKEKGYTAHTICSDKCFQMQKDIFEAQFLAEHNEELFFISDRNAIDPIVYTRMYSPGAEDWGILCTSEEWKILRTRYGNEDKSLVVLFEPVKKFLVDDGTRKMPSDWNEWVNFGNMFADFLNEQGIPYQVLGENCMDIKDRVDRVVKWVDN